MIQPDRPGISATRFILQRALHLLWHSHLNMRLFMLPNTPRDRSSACGDVWTAAQSSQYDERVGAVMLTACHEWKLHGCEQCRRVVDDGMAGQRIEGEGEESEHSETERGGDSERAGKES